jgi:hypothetical protein
MLEIMYFKELHSRFSFFYIADRTFEVGRLLELCHCLHVVDRIPVDGTLKQCNYSVQQKVDIFAPSLLICVLVLIDLITVKQISRISEKKVNFVKYVPEGAEGQGWITSWGGVQIYQDLEGPFGKKCRSCHFLFRIFYNN